MEIAINKKDKAVLFHLEGSLDIYTSLDFKTALENNIKDGSPEVVIDLHNLNYIDSSGIGVLIKALNYVQSMGGKMSVANLKPAIEKVFKVSGLTSYFEILSPEKFKELYPAT